ncbi:uncharacterized protein N7518_003805 [Penicillium psychrosexuale]|uniref:uncharacterized protein n=1 Tax=Penicillium psychrosexuale TaxID=1002107 RepID=UPI002545A226|nr:uncharacterized protein N7518_003805 [Penicillium psychrosexuale]KAJ5801737.1 hypothetical protein N7518_003805 [Penicillium psychrosexuale]
MTARKIKIKEVNKRERRLKESPLRAPSVESARQIVPVEPEAMETKGETKTISESEAKVLRSLTRRYILASSLAQIALPHRVRRLLQTHRQRNYPALLSMPIGYATLVSPPASAPRNQIRNNIRPLAIA